MQYKQIDREVCKQLRNDIQKLLDAYGAKVGLKMSVGNMRFTDTEVNIKVSAKTQSDTAAKSRRVKEVIDALGIAHMSVDGYTIVDYKPQASKYPIIYTAPNGKRFKTSVTSAKLRFGVK